MKRAFDLIVIFLLLPVWLPLCLVIAAVVAVFMGWPVLFCDERAGKGGRAFTLVKFRTMRAGEGDDAARLTRVGRALRALSMDELPEMWNVLRGEMSLVGPRPLPVRYLPRYSAFAARRHEVRPGITGLAQVNGRNALDWEEKFRLDVHYVDHRSFWMDIVILVRTIAAVILPRGITHGGSATMPEFRG